MEQYLTIGELSKLSGSSIRCLRYYDELGILKPAYINGQTGYRYYTMEQLTTLSLIQVCNELDIPLKQFWDYSNDDGNFAFGRLVETGEAIAREKIRHLRQLNQKLEALSDYLSDLQRSKAKEGIYDRAIKSRSFALLPYQGDPCDGYMRMKALTDLYLQLKDNAIAVLYQQGLLFCCEDDGTTGAYCVTEIIRDKNCPVDVLTVPAGTYRCQLFPAHDTQQAYTAPFAGQPRQGDMVFLIDYLDERQQRYTERQELTETFI